VVLDEFKAFVLRGNVIELAIAVVLGIAFGMVISAVVSGLITPLIAIPGTGSFADLDFEISGSTFEYGTVIDAIINFVLVAAAIFFVVVKPLMVMQKRREAAPAKPTTRDCPFCLSEIPRAAVRCANCTSEVRPMSS
jgi:large conductance mechanosensitive channel